MIWGLQSGAQQTEEGVSPRIEHDTDVGGPSNQVSRLRMANPAIIAMSGVQIKRTRIGIFVPCNGINLVHEMGAILGAANRLVLSQGCRCDLPPFLAANQPNRPNIPRVMSAGSPSTDRSSAHSQNSTTHSNN